MLLLRTNSLSCVRLQDSLRSGLLFFLGLRLRAAVHWRFWPARWQRGQTRRRRRPQRHRRRLPAGAWYAEMPGFLRTSMDEETADLAVVLPCAPPVEEVLHQS